MKMLNKIPKVDKCKQTVQVELTLEEVALVLALVAVESIDSAQTKVDDKEFNLDIKFDGVANDVPYLLYRDCGAVLRAHEVTGGF